MWHPSIRIIVLGCALGVLVTSPPVVAAVGPELAIDAQAPIVHQPYFRGERELFGYKPLFTPNTVTFDPLNVPYMCFGVQNGKDVVQRTDGATDGVVQTLDANGNWVRLSFADDIRAKYPTWNGTFSAGTFFEERVVFDDAGDAYMLVNNTRGSNINRNLLLYSKDKARTWQVYELPNNVGYTQWAYFEVPDAQSKMIGPPTIRTFGGSFGDGSPINLFRPTKTANGKLTVPTPVQIVSSTSARSGVSQAGLANATATSGDLTHLVYMSKDPITGVVGTPQYAVTYNRATGRTTAPLLLGVNGTGAPDVHNAPAIAEDSQGFLHVLLGSHHGQFKYMRSLVPNSTTGGWTTPVAIGKSNPSGKGYTYISMVIDPNDTIDVVARYSGDDFKFGLDFLRKSAGGDWEDHGHLVMPFHSDYSTWDQKLTIDERGRLFLRYSYLIDHMSTVEADAYRAKWPAETISLGADGWWVGLQHHDPAILMSDTGGDSWRVATTEDFRAGILPEPGGLAIAGVVALIMRRSRGASNAVNR